MRPDTIEVRGLRGRGHHGVLAHERRDGQDFVVDLVLEVDARPAGASDDLTQTVDYGDVSEAVHAVLTGEPVDLLETLVERVAGVVLGFAGVLAVEVAVHKPQAPVAVPFEDVVVRVRRSPAPPAQGVPVVLALGSNLGEREAVLASALQSLAHLPGLHVRAASPVVETAAVGPDGVDPSQQDYLNAVLLATTTLAPLELLAACRRVEAGHGRVRRERWGARTLDVDVVDLDGVVDGSDDRLVLPHPRAHERAFVLVPWSLADPGARLPGPGGGLVRDLAAAAGEVRRRDDVVLQVPACSSACSSACASTCSPTDPCAGAVPARRARGTDALPAGAS